MQGWICLRPSESGENRPSVHTAMLAPIHVNNWLRRQPLLIGNEAIFRGREGNLIALCSHVRRARYGSTSAESEFQIVRNVLKRI